MRKNGFTLIELLAVIVILAIISLIATPIILGIIKDAKEQANQRSVDNYAKAVQNAVVRNQLNENNNINGCFTTEDGTNLTLLDKTESNLIIEYEGSNIKCNTIEIYKDGNVYLDECIVNRSDKKYSYGKKQGYNDGDIVYFDVYNGVACTKDDYLVNNSKTGYNGYTNKDSSNNETAKLETQTSCLKFYAFNDSCGDTINLLLDHNTTAAVSWATTGSNVSGPITLLPKLLLDVLGWNGTITPSNYTMDQSQNSSKANYEIDYTGYNARLITAQEIAQITGADKEDTLNWKEAPGSTFSSYSYYFDGKKGSNSNWQDQVANETNKSDYYWLFDRTNECVTYGCKQEDSTTNGYWTSSSSSPHSSIAWAVNYQGDINNFWVGDSESFGIRPVIEVSKAKLK